MRIILGLVLLIFGIAGSCTNIPEEEILEYSSRGGRYAFAVFLGLPWYGNLALILFGLYLLLSTFSSSNNTKE